MLRSMVGGSRLSQRFSRIVRCCGCVTLPRRRRWSLSHLSTFLSARSRGMGRVHTGSSRNRILGRVISWLATLTRRFCPPDIPFFTGVPIMVLSCFSSPNARISSPTLPPRLPLLRDSRAANSIVSFTVKDPFLPSVKLLCGLSRRLTNQRILLLHICTYAPQSRRIEFASVD